MTREPREEATAMSGLTRRQLLITAGVAAGMSVPLFPGTGHAAPPRRVTPNGWPVVEAGALRAYRIEGSNAQLMLLPGPTAGLLLHVCRRFHYEIDALAAGEAAGHRAPGAVTAGCEVNRFSGTAVALRPGAYPAGVRGGFFPVQLLVVRDILAECEGLVRWGGDEAGIPAEGHFQIDVAPGDPRLGRLADRFGGWRSAPGRGPGAIEDPLRADRRAAARALQRRQARN
ncbi:hypothetical protein OHA21_20180 [Actinoplanes sp. NBC_00393]|uniref:hypothetical protein n=1 Tax=Actinoplanes sp. NBC_00393 TaxID=2975953 RepID=UPI002E1A3C90